MKKVISLLLSIVMCLSLGVPAFAADVDTGDDVAVAQDASIAAQADTGTASDMRLTLPTAITVHDDRMGGYTVSSAEVRNDSAAKATITGVTVTPAQHWSIMDWDSTRANVPVNSKTFSMKVFSTAIDTEGNLPDGTTLPQVAGGSASDMDVSFWMAPQSDAYGEQQVANIVVTAEFEDLSVHAILYDDGELVFQKGSTPEEGRTVTATYAGVETATHQLWSSERSSIKTVTFNCDVAPVSTYSWFQFCSNLTTINGLEKLDTSSVSNMGYMFHCCSSLEHLDLSTFDTGNAVDMGMMFYNCLALTTLDVSNFDTAKVTDMNGMFTYCENLASLDLSSFDTSNVNDIYQMFNWCNNLATIYASDRFIITELLDDSLDEMFSSCNSLAGSNGTAYNKAHVKTVSYAHIDIPGNPGYFSVKPADITVEDYTAGVATITAPANGWRKTVNTFTVSSEKACGVGLLRDGVMTELVYTSESGADHTYEVTLQDGDTIAVVLKGDVNLDGSINGSDPYAYVWDPTPVKALASDMNFDGMVNKIDTKCIMRFLVGSFTPVWKFAESPEFKITELKETVTAEFSPAQIAGSDTASTLSFALDGDGSTEFDIFLVEVDWTSLSTATSGLTLTVPSGYTKPGLETDGVDGNLGDGTGRTEDISTISKFVSQVEYNMSVLSDDCAFNLNFTFNENLAPGRYEIPVTITSLATAEDIYNPVYYATEDHPIHLTAVLEVTDAATASLDTAAALDSMAATPPATDAVTAPAESDNTYEVGDDTDIVEVPETPDVTPEPEPQPSPEPEQEEEPKQEPGSEPEPTPEPTPEPEQETPAANSDPVTKPDEVTPEKPDDGDGEELGTGETEAGDELTPEQTATA